MQTWTWKVSGINWIVSLVQISIDKLSSEASQLFLSQFLSIHEGPFLSIRRELLTSLFTFQLTSITDSLGSGELKLL